MKRFLIKISGLFCLINSHCFAIEVPIYDFNLSPFSQVIEDYISPKADNYTKPLVNAAYQQAQLRRFYRHYYASDEQGLSPWSEAYVMTILPTIYQQESQLLAQFNNKDKAFSEKHYGENFKERDEHWWYNIQTNVDLENMSMLFQPDHMAITVANTFARALPEMAPDFYHASIPGQGFPFDNLQDSALWVGTPLYVLHTSKDKAWSLVLTPDGYSSWVKSTDIAYVSSDFIQQWQAQAQKKWAAVTATNVAVYDSTHHFLFSGYIGAVFPMVGQDKERIT
ncbi:MAG TPA: SH3 domain-containing protein, partial [Legionellaceae bacterium]|nr:SH3 domain-containing protein [Legionellaceae bacterium]